MLCLTLSHWFKSKEADHQIKKFTYTIGANILNLELIKKFEKETGIQVVYETLIQMKRWKPKFVMAVHIMMLLFLVDLVRKIEKRSFIVTNRS